MAHDYHRAGLALDPPGIRIARLTESLQVLKGLWAGGPFSFHGDHYTIDGLEQEPTPIQRPGPRIMLGGGGPKMLALAAREADIINLTMRVRADGTGPDTADSGAESFTRKIDIVREAAGARFDKIEMGTSVLQVGLGRSPEQWSAANPSAQAGTPQVLVGELSEICDTLRRWREELGISYFVLHNEGDLPSFREVVAQLAEV
jgi:alkanesulfonate monooxygenase SsuD/methylene tetrahydromethanopterin reductase-like flavin-dependent oxidoreductase (luciferase family)